MLRKRLCGGCSAFRKIPVRGSARSPFQGPTRHRCGHACSVKRQLKQEFGFSTPGSTEPYQSPVEGRLETEMVTGDLNAALVEWVVQYRISGTVRLPSFTAIAISSSLMRPSPFVSISMNVSSVRSGYDTRSSDNDAMSSPSVSISAGIALAETAAQVARAATRDRVFMIFPIK